MGSRTVSSEQASKCFNLGHSGGLLSHSTERPPKVSGYPQRGALALVPWARPTGLVLWAHGPWEGSSAFGCISLPLALRKPCRCPLEWDRPPPEDLQWVQALAQGPKRAHEYLWVQKCPTISFLHLLVLCKPIPQAMSTLAVEAVPLAAGAQWLVGAALNLLWSPLPAPWSP